MRDARRFSAREVSQGVQRDVLAWATWVDGTVMAHGGALPLGFAQLPVPVLSGGSRTKPLIAQRGPVAERG